MSDGRTDMDAFKELVTRAPNMELMNIDELHGMVFWSGAAVKWAKTNIAIAKELGGLTAQIDAWLAEGNAAAEFNFAARAKRGELAKKEDQVKAPILEMKRDPKTGRAVGGGSAPSGQPSKWERLGYKSLQAMLDDELLHNHPKIVEKVKKLAKESGDFPSVVAVKSERRAQRAEAAVVKAKELAAQSMKEQVEKEVKQRPKIVSDYFEAIKHYRDVLKLAAESAKRGMFAEESINIIITKHNELRTLMEELEKSI